MKDVNQTDAFQYALSLGVRHHLSMVETKLKQLAFPEGQSDDETIHFQDQLNDLAQVQKYALGKVAIFYRKKARETGDSLTESLELLILGPDIKLFQVSHQLSTANLVDKIEKECAEGTTPQPAFVSERERALGEKLHILLSTLNTSDQLTDYCCGYLTQLAHELDILGGSSSLILKTESVIDLLRQYVPEGTHHSDDLANLFTKLLRAHVEMLRSNSKDELINMLREQGNNLMLNRGYAQALRIYTNALDLCGPESRKSIPQLLTNRAIAYIGLFCFPEAITDLNEAVSVEKSFTPAWAQLGYCQLYMGNSLLALKCYVITLRTLVGQVVPEDLGSSEHAAYRRMKMKTVLPQFVQKISQSITLVEKRAYQQNEPLAEIRKAIVEVRRILAIMRLAAPELDSEYFVYYPHVRESMLRSILERVNRNRPGILTPEAGHNVLISTSMGGGSTGITTEVIPLTDPFEVPFLLRMRENGDGTQEEREGREQGREQGNEGERGTREQPREGQSETGFDATPTIDLFRDAVPEGLRNVLSHFRTGHFNVERVPIGPQRAQRGAADGTREGGEREERDRREEREENSGDTRMDDLD